MKLETDISKNKPQHFLRVSYTNNNAELDCVDLALNPRTLVYLDSQKDRKFIKPIDYLTPEDIGKIKIWVVETIIKLDNEWKRYSSTMPGFIQTIGGDLAILMETIATADLVLTRIWETGDFRYVQIDPTKHHTNNMLQYEIPGNQYGELLNDKCWIENKGIKTQAPIDIGAYKYDDVFFSVPYWRKMAYKVLGVNRISKHMKLNFFSIFLMKMGLSKPSVPSLFLVPYKDNLAMLQYPNSVIVDDYLNILPQKNEEVNALHSKLLSSLENWFKTESHGMEAISIYRNILSEKIIGFVKARKDLIAAYVKIKNIKTSKSLKLLLPSAIGCASDAWVSMAIQERGGMDASCQHGGSHNSYQPYHLFSEARFSYLFTYGSVSPTYKFLEENGKAKIVTCGSPVLKSIVEKSLSSPKEVKRVLYIMNLCVPFYSANFPWEFVLKQFEVLELLNSFSQDYTIHVKEDQTGTVNRSNYPGLEFINVSPREVLDQYDLLILESGLSTAVLEGVVTNKFLAIFTGAEWEDTTKESLDMLEKRAECFHTMDDFIKGLGKILTDPQHNLDRTKLSSSAFQDAYCNPVTVESFFRTIKTTMELNEFS